MATSKFNLWEGKEGKRAFWKCLPVMRSRALLLPPAELHNSGNSYSSSAGGSHSSLLFVEIIQRERERRRRQRRRDKGREKRNLFFFFLPPPLSCSGLGWQNTAVTTRHFDCEKGGRKQHPRPLLPPFLFSLPLAKRRRRGKFV